MLALELPSCWWHRGIEGMDGIWTAIPRKRGGFFQLLALFQLPEMARPTHPKQAHFPSLFYRREPSSSSHGKIQLYLHRWDTFCTKGMRSIKCKMRECSSLHSLPLCRNPEGISVHSHIWVFLWWVMPLISFLISTGMKLHNTFTLERCFRL